MLQYYKALGRAVVVSDISQCQITRKVSCAAYYLIFISSVMVKVRFKIRVKVLGFVVGLVKFNNSHMLCKSRTASNLA